MTPEQTTEPGPGRTRSEWLTFAARFAWPLAFVAVVAMVLSFLRDRPKATEHAVEIAPSSTVVRSLREMARLETTSLHVEKIIDVTDRQKKLYGLVDAEDSLLFVATGEVIVGVDLQRLRDTDARFDEATKTATITLPEPEVLSTRFDEMHSYVHSRKTDTLASRNEQLEATARREATAAFEAAGREKDVSDRAKAQAERELSALATAWGAKKVVVTWRPLLPGELETAP